MSAPAIAFDIDGVFKAGRYFFEDGLRALAAAKAAGCPVAFVTNGGAGFGEAEYLEALKKKVTAAAPASDQTPENAAHLAAITEDSMILSYTPMSEDPSFKTKRLLLVGDPKEMVKARAAAYGWTNAIHVSDYCATNPMVDPFAEARETHTSHAAVANPSAKSPPAPSPKGDFGGAAVGEARARARSHSGPEDPENDNFEAVVVMTDPHDWFEALQVIVDVVVSSSPNSPDVMEFDTSRVVPVHFSNPDIFWKAAHSQPRFGQGAFRLAFETLLRSRFMLLKAPPALVDMKLREVVVQWGKPSAPTLTCAEKRLTNMRSGGKGGETGDRGGGFWMVGDNPASDMALAALGGGRWRGVLVLTGVYADTDATCGAAHVAPGVSGAVAYILQTANAEARRTAATGQAAAAAGDLAAGAAAEAGAGAAGGTCSTPSCICPTCTCGSACACGAPVSQGVPGCDPCKDAKAAKEAAAVAT